MLLQQGRLVLDSDVAAAADAADTLLRDLAADVGCETGSPDLGYLATPGPLVAIFETLDGVALPDPSASFKAHRDYGRKYKERFPSLYVGGLSAAGAVSIHGRVELQTDAPASPRHYPKLRIWARIPAGTVVDVTVEGIPTTIVGVDEAAFHPYDVDVAALVTGAYGDLTIGFSGVAAGNEAWIGMIEGLEEAQQSAGQHRPYFWVTRGRYYLKGLEVEHGRGGDDGQYPGVSFPPAAGFDNPPIPLGSGDLMVAYLEGWERLVTHVEDKGLLEQALGGALDTAVRTRAIGQVKLAFFRSEDIDVLASAGDVPKAFAAVDEGTAELVVTTTPTVDNPDPCAIPEAGGYTGPDNRFYRFEVHTGGDLGTVEIKWSKNNGADLFGALVADAANGLVTLSGGADVRDGDLVELLFEVDDLGDAGLAEISLTAPWFRPAERKVGALYYAQTTSVTGQIRLLDLATKTQASVDPALAAKPGAKVRLWHGLLRTAPVNGNVVSTFDLGDGIAIELAGASFRPGSYWQYEARKLKDNSNGPWQKSPHGPERLFAPLALFSFDDGGKPLVLERWYDHQFSAICELNADDIAYDGAKVGTGADTVQEALDELYEKDHEGGCCDVSLSPAGGGDDGARIQGAIDDLPEGGVICLRRGVYDVRSTITVREKRVEIVGCPEAVLIGRTEGPMFRVAEGGELALEKLIARADEGSGAVVSLQMLDPSPAGEGFNVMYGVTIREAALVHTGGEGFAVQEGGVVPAAVDPAAPEPLSLFPSLYNGGHVRVESSILVSAWTLAADCLRSCDVSDSVLVCARAGIYAARLDALSVRRSSIRSWLTEHLRKELASAAPASLDAALRRALEQLYGDVSEGSFGILVGGLENTIIEETSIHATAGVRARRTHKLRSVANDVHARSGPAVRIDVATFVTLSGDTLGSASAAVHVPFTAYNVRVEKCAMSSPFGVVLGAMSTGTALPPENPLKFEQVCIVGNRFLGFYKRTVEDMKAGVLVGPLPADLDGDGDSDPVFGDIRTLDVSGNLFIAGEGAADVAIGSTLLSPDLDRAAQRAIRIWDNLINGGSYGIIVYGSGAEIKQNTIARARGRARRAREIGIGLFDATGAVVAGNVVRVDGGEVEGDVVGIGLFKAWTEGASRDARIEHNTVACGSRSTPLLVARTERRGRHDRIRVIGNDLQGSGCELRSLFACVIQENRFRCSVTIDEAHDGVVSDNVLEDATGKLVALDITHAEGDWQIADNRSEGHIRLLPAYRVLDEGVRGERSSELSDLVLRALVSGPVNPSVLEEQLVGHIEGAFSPVASRAEGIRTTEAVRGAPVRGPLRGEAGERALRVDEIVARELSASFLHLLEEIDPSLTLEEAPYQAQVTGNWATGDLVIGFAARGRFETEHETYRTAYSSARSVIQIISNRADTALITNHYRHHVVAHNTARVYHPSFGSAEQITTPNYDYP
ncbi:hypothetical protein [Sorangium cellulosum]|uniref:Right handed beta helix domain-containing protein n=1 Tax=Sorangium cellulosum So0157-2 TaxID=1254432 RepID=S4YAZ8_SORCE|nr:hypothetical protein [Sorangium cellulosum]AGP41495.1 hypothetical protein SCE1572_47635 [Sorangium cellulosum So0157-2]